MRSIGWLKAAAALLVAGGAVLTARAQVSPAAAPERHTPVVTAAISRLPLSFEVNRGQAPPRVAFLAHAGGYTAFMTPSAIDFTLVAGGREPSHLLGGRATRAVRSTRVSLHFLGADSHVRIAGEAPLPGKVNYFIGRDPGLWRTHIPTFSRIVYRNLYEGIDLLYYGHGDALEYDWIVHPHADLGAVRLQVRGEGRLVLGRHGSLLVRTAVGTLVQGAPTGYQGEGSTERHVPVRFTLGPRGTAGIAARYDRTRRLVVDPAIGWATYLGGRGADSAHGIATDPAGNIYLAGTTGSADFPVKGSIEPFHTNPTGTGLIDVFVSKLNSAGTAIIFSTYLGGSSFDESYGLARDGTGICLAGDTGSRDFPLKNAFQPTYGGGGSDAFITRLAPAGDALIYSSYLGGSADDRFYGVADDGKGTCFAAGDSIPLSSGGGNSPVYPPHAIVARVGPNGSLQYNITLAGSQADSAYGIAADGAGNAYVVGLTGSNDFPSERRVPPTNLGPVDGFVVKLDPTGKTIIFSTHLGGSEITAANAIARGPGGNVWVVGQTAAPDFPVVDGSQRTYGGGTSALLSGDAFVAEVDRFGRIRYSTFLGGSRDDEARVVAVDASHNVWVAGWTDSADFPVRAAIQPAFTGAVCYSATGTYPCADAFVSELDGAGRLAFSTFLGGSDADYANALAAGPAGAIDVAGGTESIDMQTVRAVQARNPSSDQARSDAFVIKLVPGTSRPTTALVIDRIEILHTVEGQLRPTGVVRLGERIRIVAFYHDRRGAGRRALGTLVVSHSGHEIVQESMTGAIAGGQRTVNAAIALHSRSDVGPLVAQVAVISEGMTAQSSRRFVLQGH